MNVIGLIAEYNPFHNGHLYQINEIKKMYKDCLIVCVISTNFSQRGELSLLNKWEKAKIALENNIDIVVELPYLFTVQCADVFAHAALQILNEFKIDTIIFGSETHNLEYLKSQAKNVSFDKIKYRKYLKEGFNHPAIMSKLNNTSKNPNDILGISYIREIFQNNYDINPISIKRTNNYHDIKSKKNIVSASNIREKYYNSLSYKKYVPVITYKNLKNKNINKKMFFDLIKYKVFSSKDLSVYLDVDKGIDFLLQNIYDYENEDIIKNIKSKRYTYNKIYRMLNHLLIGLTKNDAKNIKDIEYIRILGFNSKGKKHLNKIKKDFKYQIVYNHNKNYISSIYELKSTKIYSLITNNSLLIEKEYKKNVIIIK